MELTTFGGLLKFALELERAATQFYGEAAEAAPELGLKAGFEELITEGKKDKQRLERLRRESVNEMLLESFQGLEGDDYRVELKPSPEMGDDELLALALQLEGVLERFYCDAAGRLSLPEVARGFERLAKEHAQRKVKLEEI